MNRESYDRGGVEADKALKSKLKGTIGKSETGKHYEETGG